MVHCADIYQTNSKRTFLTPVFLTSLFLALIFSGCVTTNYNVKKTYDPLLGTQAFPEVEKQLSKAMTFTTVKGNCKNMAITYNNLSQRQAQHTDTVYTERDFLNKASSESETRNYTVYSGDNYWFYFQDRVLKYYSYDKINSSGKTVENTEGGDPKVKEFFNNMPDDQQTGCTDGYYYTPQKAEEKPAAETSGTLAGTLEQKLEDLKKLKDKKVITPEEYKEMRKKILDNVK